MRETARALATQPTAFSVKCDRVLFPKQRSAPMTQTSQKTAKSSAVSWKETRKRLKMDGSEGEQGMSQ